MACFVTCHACAEGVHENREACHGRHLLPWCSAVAITVPSPECHIPLSANLRRRRSTQTSLTDDTLWRMRARPPPFDRIPAPGFQNWIERHRRGTETCTGLPRSPRVRNKTSHQGLRLRPATHFKSVHQRPGRSGLLYPQAKPTHLPFIPNRPGGCNAIVGRCRHGVRAQRQAQAVWPIETLGGATGGVRRPVSG